MMKQFIDGVKIYTADENSSVIDDGAIMIEGTTIAAVVDKAEQFERYLHLKEQAHHIVQSPHMLAMPGLINAHTHLFQTFMRGLGEGLPLYAWLKDMIWPISIAMEPEDFYYAALLGCLEAIKGGTTTLVDNHYINCDPSNSDMVLEAMRESGIRGVLARGYANKYYHPDILESASTVQAELNRLLKKWHGAAQGRLRVCPGPLSPVRCTPELFRWTGDFALSNGLLLHTHVAETQTVRDETIEDYGLSNVRFLKSVNMLHPSLNLVHSVKVDEDEMDLIRDAGAHIVHCPISNMYLGSGVAPIAQYLRRDINVASASDGPASNNSQNMFETIKISACQQRAVTEDPDAVSMDQAIRMATVNGGIALGNTSLGTIKEGAAADLILLDTRAAHLQPYHSAGATIAYSAQASDVDTVFVNGQMVLRGKTPLFLDEQALLGECSRRIRRIIARSTYGKEKQ